MKLKKVCDLHTHSYYSDGEFSPEEIVRKAKNQGIKVLALTDHNSVKGIDKAINKAKKIGITIIPAVEILVAKGEVLGYFIDHKNLKLQRELKKLSKPSDKKVRMRIKALEKIGIDISVSRFEKLYPHAKGNYQQGNINNYFNGLKKMSKDEYYNMIDKIRKIKPKVKKISIIEAIKLIKKYNGIPVLAHPWIGEYNKKYKFNEKFIKELVKVGLQGLEFENGEENNFGRTPSFIKKIKKLAKKYNLILTSGSDFHGPVIEYLTGTHKLGKYNCDYSVFEELKKLKAKNELRRIPKKT